MGSTHESILMQKLNDEDGQRRRVISEKTIQVESEFSLEETIDMEINLAVPMTKPYN